MKTADQSYLVKIVLIVRNKCSQPEARIIGVMRLTNKKENGKYAVLYFPFGAKARSADSAFAPKPEPRFKRI